MTFTIAWLRDAVAPLVVQGFAWRMGLDRIAMLTYGMPDLHACVDAGVRWLEHYGVRDLDLPTLVGGLTGWGNDGVVTAW